jgi:hypothetical protein
MFVQVLWNIEGNPSPNGVTSAEPWYHNAILWAVENSISDGTDPSREITRQEMAVMLMNYANYKGYDIPIHRAAINFSDMTQIASWASSAVQSISAAGVLSGYNNAFNPLETATRAEVAQMFRNFMRFVVNDNFDTNRTQTAAAQINNTMDLYIDRRAMEEIERALLVDADGESEPNTLV